MYGWHKTDVHNREVGEDCKELLLVIPMIVGLSSPRCTSSNKVIKIMQQRQMEYLCCQIQWMAVDGWLNRNGTEHSSNGRKISMYTYIKFSAITFQAGFNHGGEQVLNGMYF